MLYQQAMAMEQDGNAKDAIRIYRRAARAGSGKAAKRLGEIYDRGVPGVSRDYAESLQWYETARQLRERIETLGRRGGPEVPVPATAPTPEPPKAAAPTPSPAPETKTGWFSTRGLLIALLVLALIAWRRYRRREKSAARQAQRASAAAVDLKDATTMAAARSIHRPGKVAVQAAPSAATLFVSYSHKDRSRVEPIVSVIEEMGRRVWMDRSDITGQTGWAGQIVRAIRECRAVVLMASPNSYNSDQVVRELYLAMNHRKTIVPIEIEPAEMPDELQYILAPFQHHRLSAGETRAVLGRALAAV